MRTTDLFKNNRSSKRLNESLAKTFGTRLDLESFDTPKLEDARNKLRTQIHTARQESGFNETIENETLTQAQFMHDAIVAELMDRQEHIVDNTQLEGRSPEVEEFLTKVANDPQAGYDMLYDAQMGKFGKEIERVIQDMYDDITIDTGYHGDDDFEQIYDRMLDNIESDYADKDVKEGAMSEIAIELAQVADDEDYDKLYDLLSDPGPVGQYLQDKIDEITGETGLHPKDDIEKIEPMLMDIIQQEFGGQNDDEGGETDDNYALASAGFGSDEDYESIETEDASSRMSMAQELYKSNPDLDSEDDILNAGFAIMKQRDGAKAARYYFSYDEDFPSDFISEYKWLQRQEHDVGEDLTMERDRDPEDWDEGNTEPPNNFAVSINGKQWKVFKGRGQYAEDDREKQHYRQLKDWAAKKSESTGKKWEVNVTGAPATESIQRTQGESMSNLREGEVQQASAIVTAKTMVDRVSRWIEELSSMENDTLLQLGDSIRDEMGQEQAKGFISSVAPAIQQALENLKSTRETMATGVRQLTGEEQGAEMLGGEPAGMGGDEMGPAEPDAMNMDADMGDMGGEDEFAAAEPAAGGLGDAGREQRESINRSSSLLKVLAG
jgi:hypothetical protein